MSGPVRFLGSMAIPRAGLTLYISTVGQARQRFVYPVRRQESRIALRFDDSRGEGAGGKNRAPQTDWGTAHAPRLFFLSRNFPTRNPDVTRGGRLGFRARWSRSGVSESVACPTWPCRDIKSKQGEAFDE